MSRSTAFFIIVLAIVAILLGYNYVARPFYQTEEITEVGVPLEDVVSSESEDLVDPRKKALNRLSAEQKIAQIMTYPHVVGTLVDYSSQDLQATNSATILNESNDSNLSSTSSAEATSLSSAKTDPYLQLQDFQPGLIIFYGSRISRDLAEREIKEIKQLFIDRPFQPLLAVDHEGGSVQRFSGDGFTVLPSWRQLCQESQMSRQEKLLESAHELLELDIDIVFSPVVDLNSSVLSNRSCADKNDLASAARNYIEIFGSRNIMPVIKHYPGLGSTTRDLHDFSDEIEIDNTEVEIFKNLLSLYPTIGVMTGHVGVVNNFDGLPCSLSIECVNEIFNTSPTAMIFSDALEMKALENYYAESDGFNIGTQSAIISTNSADVPEELSDLARVSYLAIMAGNHVLVYGEGVEFEQLNEVKSELAKLYEKDELFAEKVNQAAMRMLDLKQ